MPSENSSYPYSRDLVLLEEALGQAQEKVESTNPHHLTGLLFFFFIIDTLGLLIGVLNFVPFIGVPLALFLQFVFFMTVQVTLVMLADIFKYARRARTILRIAAWLEIVPLLGALPGYVAAMFLAMRTMRKRHNEALEERAALFEQYAAFLQEQQELTQQTNVAQSSVAQQEQEIMDVNEAANDNDERAGVEAAMRRLEMRRPPNNVA